MFNGFDKSLLSQKAIMLNKYLLKILPGILLVLICYDRVILKTNVENSEEFYEM